MALASQGRRGFIKTAGSAAVVTAVGCVARNVQTAVPVHLRGYEALYAQNPNAAAVQWFKDAKFGLFVHYALVSQLRGGKPEYVRRVGDRNKVDPVKDEALKQELFKTFAAEKFDADALCDLALAANMRYINLTTQHLGRLHLHRTTLSDFTSLNAPAGRDLVAEMAAACRKRGLGLLLYVPPEVARTDEDYFERNHTLLRELLSQYGPVAGIWFDGIGNYMSNPENYARLSETFALIRSIQPHALISFKEGAIGEEDFISPEHFLLPFPVDGKNPKRQAQWDMQLERWNRQNKERWEKWYQYKPAEINTVMQECRGRDGVSEPSGWINDENARHLSADEVMFLLKTARSLNANMLMNIGPRGDGSVHPDDDKALREVGRRIRADGFPGERG